MVNWLKVSGIVLMILGILIIVAGFLSFAVISPWHQGATVIGPPLWVFPLGIAMIVIGVYLYYLGKSKEKKGV
jgi:uncharacterized membrane protein